MKKIILTKGLPASGKTKWAKEYIEAHQGKVKRVNKDDLRNMIDAGIWSKNNEKFVLEIRDFFITTALLSGYDVIVDDTNLHPKHEQRLKELAENNNNILSPSLTKREKIVFEIKDFTNVSLETCLDRDEKRENRVGSKVIMQMYNQFLKPKPPTIIYNPKLPNAIISDLDGTLALFDDANPYDRDFSKDILNKPVADIINQYQEDEYKETKIIIVSGRKDIYREQTVKWLHKYNISYSYLFMRKVDDNRKDVIVKKEIYEKNIKGKFNVLFVIDDRPSVIKMWREDMGLFVLDCNQSGIDF